MIVVTNEYTFYDAKSVTGSRSSSSCGIHIYTVRKQNLGQFNIPFGVDIVECKWANLGEAHCGTMTEEIVNEADLLIVNCPYYRWTQAPALLWVRYRLCARICDR